MLRKDIEQVRSKYRFDRVDIGSKCQPHTRKWILLLIFFSEIIVIFLLLDYIDAFFACYEWAKTSAFIIFSLPIAFYLWMWRNHDKNMELSQKERELEDARINADLAFFNTCMEKLIDKKIPSEIRDSYLTSFEPYILGNKGLEYELQSLTFINGIFKNKDKVYDSVKKQFAKSFNWYIQNGMFFFTEFHEMMLDHFSFSGINVANATFVNCSMSSCHFAGDYSKAMFVASDLSHSIFQGCNFSGAMVISCNFSKCLFCECKIPFSILQSSNITEAVFVNSEIIFPDNFNKKTESIFIVYTSDKKGDALLLKEKFPNAICKEIENISSFMNSPNFNPLNHE